MNTAPSQASQPTTVQGTSQKGKAAEQSNQPGTSKGTKAVPSKPFQGKGGNVPKPGQKPAIPRATANASRIGARLSLFHEH